MRALITHVRIIISHRLERKQIVLKMNLSRAFSRWFNVVDSDALQIQFEADRRAFIITLNSFGTELSKEDRETLYPTCGKLHPEGLRLLAQAEDFEQMKRVADSYGVRAYPGMSCVLSSRML